MMNRNHQRKVNMTTWILVADASRARIFETAGANQELCEVEALVHPESRKKTSELVNDRPGRVSRGQARSSMEAHTSPHAVEADRFAHLLAKVLDRGVERREYSSVVIVAPPHFMGLLRSAISNRVFN